MSNESLDYQKLCSNYYLSYEDGCCMESCEFYNHNECPVVYVNGLLEKKDDKIAELETEIADAEEHIDNLELQLREQYQLVDEKDEEIALLKKEFELACEELWYMSHWRNTKEEVMQHYKEYFESKAKEIINESKS